LPDAVQWAAVAEGQEEEEIEFSWAGENARHVGTVVHRWLQQIASDQFVQWSAARVSFLKANFSRELARRGVPPKDLFSSTEVVASALINALTDDRGRWVLGPHQDARNEYRLRAHTGAGLRTLVMDRRFVDETGTSWIVDYKTSRHEGADVDAFLDRERDRYAHQLAAYAALIKNSRQGLYFPVLRGWREK